MGALAFVAGPDAGGATAAVSARDDEALAWVRDSDLATLTSEAIGAGALASVSEDGTVFLDVRRIEAY